MPQSLAPIPQGVAIVEPKGGSITEFFRLRWQSLVDGFQISPDVAAIALAGKTAAIAAASAFLTKSAGWYRVSYYMRKTVADGVSSSLTVTLGWTESGVPLTEAGAALATDTTSAQQSGSKSFWADAGVDLTYAVAYASNTPNKMTYRIDVLVEQLA